MNAEEEFKTLKAIHPEATLHSESSVSVVHLPSFKFQAGGKGVVMALLLYPASHGGYMTRLFFERRLDGAGQSNNWNMYTVLSRTWWSPSWQGVVAEQPWISMLGAHLRAVA